MAGRIVAEDILRIQAPLRAELAELKADYARALSVLTALAEQAKPSAADAADGDRHYGVPLKVVSDAQDTIAVARAKETAKQAEREKRQSDFIKSLPGLAGATQEEVVT